MSKLPPPGDLPLTSIRFLHKNKEHLKCKYVLNDIYLLDTRNTKTITTKNHFMEYQTLMLHMEAGIAVVTLNRPQALNALNTQFFHDLNAVMDGIEDKARILLITGSGKAFAAGADIAEMLSKDPAEARLFSQLGQDTFFRLEEMDIPVMAVINGFALGGGCELALACDFRIASENAVFGQPEVNLGLIPGFAATQRLPRLIGLSNALFLLLTADRINAQEALRMGLVQKVVAPESLEEESMRIAQSILQKGPEAVKKVKMVTRQGFAMGMEAGNNLENEQFGSLFGMGHEGHEGMMAFLEKRKPQWNNQN